MEHIVFFEPQQIREQLLPLTFTRPIAEIRIGIITITQKWKIALNTDFVSFITENYLSKKYTLTQKENVLLINSSIIPNNDLIEKINALKQQEVLYANNTLIAAKLNHIDDFLINKLTTCLKVQYQSIIRNIEHVWDIFKKNDQELRADFITITQGRISQTLSSSNQIIGNASDIFLEKGAKVECCILNASTGPIYVGKNAEIMEGSVIRGPFSLGEESQIKLATKIYGATTIGPHSKVGGEVNNSVIFGYTNKAHDGFLGNSVIGEWCNLGADTNNSNLKNNYGNVKLYNYASQQQEDTGLQFCGLIMGDHSKCGINTMFNTGTVVGTNVNIFGADFPPTHIPSFSWGGATGFEPFKINKAIELAERVYERRNLKLGQIDIDILISIDNMTNK